MPLVQYDISPEKRRQRTPNPINMESTVFQDKNDEFHVKVAESLDQACKLLELSFEYVTDMDGKKLFRKRK